MVHDARQHLPPVDTLHLHAASFKARGESKPVNESIELGSSISAAAKCEDEANSGLILSIYLLQYGTLLHFDFITALLISADCLRDSTSFRSARSLTHSLTRLSDHYSIYFGSLSTGFHCGFRSAHW